MSGRRPCTCERYVGGAYTSDQCRLCWLYHNDERYFRLWGGGDGPSPLRKALNFAGAVITHLSSGRKKLSPEGIEERLAICRKCDRMQGDSCRECGCHLSLKASWAEQRCPLGRWPGEGVSNKESEEERGPK